MPNVSDSPVTTAAVSASDLPVAILAGGKATRLLPITQHIPKLLVEVAGEPFFSHQLRLLEAAGLRRIVLCVGHLGEMIVDAYGDGSKYGVHIEYSFDGPELLGTGGALRRALPLLGDAFYVLYGDSYLPIDYLAVGEAFLRSQRLGLMTVFKNEGKYDTSNVWYENATIRKYSKIERLPQMQHIDYGLGLLRSGVFADLAPGVAVDLAQIYGRLVERGELAGFEVLQRFYEIGSVTGLEELDQLLRSTRTT